MHRVEFLRGCGKPARAVGRDRHADARLLADVAHIEDAEEFAPLLLDPFVRQLRMCAGGELGKDPLKLKHEAYR